MPVHGDGLAGVDAEILSLVRALRALGLETDWSCAGEPGHMVIRPTIQIRTNFYSFGETSAHLVALRELAEQQRRIEWVLAACEVQSFWLSLVFRRGCYDTHGGEAVWLLELPGRYDQLTALNVAYSAAYQTQDCEAPGGETTLQQLAPGTIEWRFP